MKRAVPLSLYVVLFCCLLCQTSIAGDRMSLGLFENKLRIGGDFYVRFETRSDYYTQDKRQVNDHGISSRQRLSLDFMPRNDMGFTFTMLRTIDGDDPHSYLFPYAYDHGADVQQAYLHLDRPMDLPFSLWAGRREIAYLNQRLIGHSYGWTNKPINFDGAGVVFDSRVVKVDVFYLNKVLRDLDEANSFNDDWFGKPSDMYGVWITLKDIPLVQKIEPYILINDDDNGNDSTTPGIRIYGKRGAFDYDINLTMQFGHKYVNGEKLERHAQAFYMDMGYTFDLFQKSRIALQYNYASGDDDPGDQSYDTFDQLYGCVHGKYGLMDFFSWQNMHDIYLYGNSSLFIKNLNMLCGVHFFWLDDTHDSWYNCYKKVQRNDPTGDPDSYVGSELDLLLTYSFLTNFKLTAFVGHFFAGSYVRDTGRDRDADYTYFQLEYQF